MKVLPIERYVAEVCRFDLLHNRDVLHQATKCLQNLISVTASRLSNAAEKLNFDS